MRLRYNARSLSFWRFFGMRRRRAPIRRIFPAAASCRKANGRYRVEVGFLGTDIERMFAENKPTRDDVDLTEPGVIEGMIGKFIQKRVDLQNAEGQTCPSTVVSVGEDPDQPL